MLSIFMLLLLSSNWNKNSGSVICKLSPVDTRTNLDGWKFVEVSSKSCGYNAMPRHVFSGVCIQPLYLVANIWTSLQLQLKLVCTNTEFKIWSGNKIQPFSTIFGSKFKINRFPICLSLPLLLAIVANKSVTSAVEF